MITLLSTSDTDLLSARACGADFRVGNPRYLDTEAVLDRCRGAEVVVYRQLGSRHAIADQLEAIRATGVPLVVVSGELAADADLMAASTTPAGVARQAHDYLAFGGPDNLAQLWAFLSDTVTLTGHGFEPPAQLPAWGHLDGDWTAPDTADGRPAPRVAVVYYRAQHLAGNTRYVEALCDAVVAAGATAVPLYCASLRQAESELIDQLRTTDTAVVTVLAAGGSTPAAASAGGEDDSWDVAHLAALDIPILQGLCLTCDRPTWEESDEGMVPLDVATQIAVPEFDGRVVTVPFSFKHLDDEGLARVAAEDVDATDVLTGVRAAGLDVSEEDLEGLLVEAIEHARVARGQLRAAEELSDAGRATVVLPALPDGVDLAGLHALASALIEQGVC